MSGKSEPPQDPGQDLARWLGELRNSNGAPAYQVIIDRIRANDATSSLSMSTLTNTFKGRGFPRYETVVAIARALGGREAAGEADRLYAQARNRRDELERRQRQERAQSDVPAESGQAGAADGGAVPPLPVATARLDSAGVDPLPVATAPLDSTGVEPLPVPAQGGTRYRLPVILGAGAFAAVVAFGITALVLTDPFDHGASASQDTGDHAAGPTSPTSTSTQRTTKGSDSARPSSPSGGAAADEDAWRGRPPLAVQAQNLHDVCGSAYFDGTPDQYRAAQTAIPAPPQNAVPLGEAVEATIQGRTQQSVILTGMRVQVTSREPAPTHGIVVSYGECGGGVEVRNFDLDLSRTPPTYTAKPADNFGKVTPAVKFPYKISLSDPEVFKLTPVKGCGPNKDCTYTVTLQWVADGKTGTTVLDNHGKGFRDLNPKDLPAYRQDLSAEGPSLRKVS